MSVAAAEGLLAVGLSPDDADRMHELIQQSQSEPLAAEQAIELDNYRRVSYLLDVIHTRARITLRNHAAS